MKRATSVWVLIAVLTTFTTHAQLVDKGQLDFNLGVGLVSFIGAGDIGLPPLSVSGDYGFRENMSLGGIVGYFNSSIETPTVFGTYTTNYTYFLIGGRYTYHYPIVENFDTYGGLLLGFNVASSSVDVPDGAPGNAGPVASAGGVFYGVFAGGRYHFNENWGAFAELGYGLSLINLGVTYRLK